MVQRESKRHLDQIPFTAKKLKPPVLRKDYWEPLCMIRFDKGQGEIGRNVFQKLREYRRLHELSWGWQAEDLIKMNKLQRGKTIHNQRRNAIADIAAVLGGQGRGNKMWTTEPEPEPVPEPTEEKVAEVEESQSAPEDMTLEREAVSKTAAVVATPAATEPATEIKPAEETLTTLAEDTAEAPAEEAPVAAKAAKKESKELQKRLLKATIYWTNDSDLNWARQWTPNVDHQIGLPDDIRVPRWKTRNFYLEPEPEPAPEPAAEEASTEGEGQEDEAKDRKVKEAEVKDTEVEEAEIKEAEVKEVEPKAEEKTEQPEEKQEPVRRGILGGLFGRKS